MHKLHYTYTTTTKLSENYAHDENFLAPICSSHYENFCGKLSNVRFFCTQVYIVTPYTKMDFALGGMAAVCAGFFTNPFDVIKTRQQLQGELVKYSKNTKQPYTGLLHSVKTILKAEGLTGLQKGLGPALAFQLVMNSTRLGLYETGDKFGIMNSIGREHSPMLCMAWGGFCGVAGASLGCPLYMIKTQIQAQSYGEFAVGYQHKHRGLIDAFRHIIKKRGIRGLWHGYTGIVPRTAVGSAAQLSTFTKSKDFLQKYEAFENSRILTAMSASFISGFFTCVAMTPFDVIATRLFNQGTDAQGRGILYKNIFDCFYKTFKIEGVRGLYKGFVPNYWRAAPHTLLNLTFWETFKKWGDIYYS